MRHGKKNNHLGRKSAHRKSMISNMACSLIEHKRINTTLAKAKVLRKEIEPILTRSKLDTTHNRRLVFSSLRSKEAVTELFREVSKKIADRPGGYTRIIKLGNRLGDNADMAMIELVDYNDLYVSEKSKKNTRRGRRKTSNTNSKAEDSTAVEHKPKEDTAPPVDSKEKTVVNKNKSQPTVATKQTAKKTLKPSREKTSDIKSEKEIIPTKKVEVRKEKDSSEKK